MKAFKAKGSIAYCVVIFSLIWMSGLLAIYFSWEIVYLLILLPIAGVFLLYGIMLLSKPILFVLEKGIRFYDYRRDRFFSFRDIQNISLCKNNLMMEYRFGKEEKLSLSYFSEMDRLSIFKETQKSLCDSNE